MALQHKRSKIMETVAKLKEQIALQKQENSTQKPKPAPLPPLKPEPEPDDKALYDTKVEAPEVPKILVTARKIWTDGDA